MVGIEPSAHLIIVPTELARFPLFLLWSSVFWHRVVSKEYAACFYSVEVGWGLQSVCIDILIWKVSSHSCNTGQKILPELQQETEDTARSIKGDRRYSQSNSWGQKIQLGLQQGTENTARSIPENKRYNHSYSRRQKIVRATTGDRSYS